MLAIAGGKGGCGKTTTTLGLARALSGGTVAVDLDRGMPDLHALADVDREPTLTNPTGAAGNGVEKPTDPLDAAQSTPGRPGVEVVAAPRTDVDDRVVASALSNLTDLDRTVLLDGPAGATEAAALPLRVADRTLLVSTLCAPALRDTAKTAAMARALDAPPIGAVLTRTRLAPDAVESLLGCPVLTSVPSVRPPVLNATVVRAAYARLARGVRTEAAL